MPSGHGGGGGGGSHFGGGSSFGGSHFGSGSSGVNSRPRYIMFFGRTIYTGDGSYGLFSSLLIFAIIAFMISSCLLAGFFNAKSKVQKIEDDRVYYLEMISAAETNGKIDTHAKVSSIVYNEDYEKYYITYTFTNASGEIDGYSFCMYESRISAPQVFNGSNYISVAYDNQTSNADSIPTDYAGFSLSDDGEYVYYNNEKTWFPIVSGLGYGVGVLLFVGSCVAIGTNIKNHKEDKDKVEGKTSGDNVNLNKPVEEENEYCPYCGSKVLKSDKKCINCGASIKKEKN